MHPEALGHEEVKERHQRGRIEGWRLLFLHHSLPKSLCLFRLLTSNTYLSLFQLSIRRAPLLYVTFRDQLLSPLLQGALWGLVGVSIAQFRSYFVAQRALSRDLKAQRLVGGPSSSSANSGGSGNGKGLAGMLGLNSRR